MSKKDFIALADAIRDHNSAASRGFASYTAFDPVQLDTLAKLCAAQNPNFKRERWLSYIAGNCGKNGGKVKELAHA